MSDDMKSFYEEIYGLNCCGFFGVLVLIGVVVLVGVSVLGSVVVGCEVWVVGKGECSKVEVVFGELDEYYGFWSGGYFGEVCVFGVLLMCELMCILVFNVDLVIGWGLINESKWVFGDSVCFFNGDCYYLYILMIDGKYDGKYLFINDKVNSWVVCICLDVMKCDCIVIIFNVQVIYGLCL